MRTHCEYYKQGGRFSRQCKRDVQKDLKSISALCQLDLVPNKRVSRLLTTRLPRLSDAYKQLGDMALAEVVGLVVGHIANAAYVQPNAQRNKSQLKNQHLLRLVLAHQMVASRYADKERLPIEQRHYVRFQALRMAFEDYTSNRLNPDKNPGVVKQLREDLIEQLQGDESASRPMYLFARGSTNSLAIEQRRYTAVSSLAANAESFGFCLPGPDLDGCSSRDGVYLGAESQVRAMLAIEREMESLAPDYVSSYIAMGFSRGAAATMQYAQKRRETGERQTIKPCKRVLLDPVAMYHRHKEISKPFNELERVHEDDSQLLIEATQETIPLKPVGEYCPGLNSQRLHFATDHSGLVTLVGERDSVGYQTAKSVLKVVANRLREYGLKLCNPNKLSARASDISVPESTQLLRAAKLPPWRDINLSPLDNRGYEGDQGSLRESRMQLLAEYRDLSDHHAGGYTARNALVQQRRLHIQVGVEEDGLAKLGQRGSSAYINRFGNGCIRFYNADHRRIFRQSYPLLSQVLDPEPYCKPFPWRVKPEGLDEELQRFCSTEKIKLSYEILKQRWPLDNKKAVIKHRLRQVIHEQQLRSYRLSAAAIPRILQQCVDLYDRVHRAKSFFDLRQIEFDIDNSGIAQLSECFPDSKHMQSLLDKKLGEARRDQPLQLPVALLNSGASAKKVVANLKKNYRVKLVGSNKAVDAFLKNLPWPESNQCSKSDGPEPQILASDQQGLKQAITKAIKKYLDATWYMVRRIAGRMRASDLLTNIEAATSVTEVRDLLVRHFRKRSYNRFFCRHSARLTSTSLDTFIIKALTNERQGLEIKRDDIMPLLMSYDAPECGAAPRYLPGGRVG